MKYIKLISIFLIALLLFGPVVSAAEIIKDPIVPIEPVKTYYDLSSKEKSLSTGYIKIDDYNTDKYTIEKIDTGYAISANLLLTDHNRELELSKDFLNTVPGFDGKKFFVHNFDSNGLYTGVRMHVIGQDDSVTVPVHFSTVVINGFSGYYTDTQTLSNGQNITVPAGADRVEASVSGIADSVAIEGGNLSTYPKYEYINYSGGFETPFYSSASTNGNTITPFIFNSSNATLVFTSLWNVSVEVPSFVIPIGDSTTSGSSIYTKASGNSNIFYRPFSSPTTSYPITSDMPNIYDGNNHTTILNFETSTHINGYVDFVDYTTPNTPPANDVIINNLGRGYSSSTYNWEGYFYDVMFYNISLSDSDITHLKTGFNGTSVTDGITYYGFQNGLAILPTNTTSVEYWTTDDIDREVTVEAWYTEDIIIIDETTDSNSFYYLNISHTAIESLTDGSIEHDTGKADLTGITMSSNKGGATFNVSGSELIIDTGATTEAETYYYNFTLPSWTIAGNVYLNGDGVALEGATIKLNGIGTTISDSSGAWNFTNVPNGIYGLSVTLSGYQSYHANLLVSGEDRTDIELHLSAFGLDEDRPDFYTLVVIAVLLLFLMFYFERRAICFLASFMALLTMLYVYSFDVFTFLAVMQMTLFVLIALIGAVKGTTSREM